MSPESLFSIANCRGGLCSSSRPCLVLTFMAGPVGLLLYLGLRVAWKRQWVLAA